MQILFVHKNYPAQFGHVAHFLATRRGDRCVFVSERPAESTGPVERIQYQAAGAATAQTHWCSRSFENATWHSHAIYEALKARPDFRPDLVVGHSGFLSTLYLRELYDCPIVNYFEYFYHTRGTDMDFRPDFPCDDLDRLRARARNSVILLDLENCDLAYSPTRWQRGLFPEPFRDKIRVIFDGVDTTLWRPRTDVPRRVAGRDVPQDVRIVTYVARGMEAMRGFDVFIRFAKELSKKRSDVIFVIVGDDRVCYGNDERFTGGRSFRDWVLERERPDLSRILFTGVVTTPELAALLAITDLHVYLTVPFVLSWSLVNALACGATVLASDTAPVREMIRHGENGLLVDFFDVEGMVEQAANVLRGPSTFRDLGAAGAELVRNRYSVDACLPQVVSLYEAAVSRRAAHDGRAGA